MRRFFIILLLGITQISFAVDLPVTSNWNETKTNKKGDILIYWFTSQPFVYEDDSGNMHGIEYEIFQAFKKHLYDKYGIELTIHYKMSNSFIDTFYDTRDDNRSGVFGMSSFSITNERKEEVNFVSPYMPDISVLISSGDVPVIENAQDFPKVFTGLTAVTIKGSTYESDLISVQKEWGVDFDLHYINSNHNILKTISDMENAFGFVDLPIYLVQLQSNPSVNVKRQNLLPIKREGYSFVIPKSSDWGQPMNEFIESEEFKRIIEDITANYFDRDLYQFIEDFYLNVNDNVVLLTKEKEMQYEDLVGKAKKIERETVMRNFLAIAVFLIIIFSVVIFILFRRRLKSANILRKQADKISNQSKELEKQKEQLENRNRELTTLNEEKNNLIKVLAHDLRSPINQIQGFMNIVMLEPKNLAEDQIAYLNKIKEITNRANKMIGKILDVDALESNRVNIIYEQVDVKKLLEHIIVTFSYDAKMKDITIDYSTDNKKGHYTISLDRLYMTQIIENLISNSLKFSNNHTKIKIELQKKEKSILISIKDQGPGFTEDDKKRLFKKFQQLSARPTSGEKSTGLGLSIVKKYVDLMKGNIWVESEENNGATFFIEFPA